MDNDQIIDERSLVLVGVGVTFINALVWILALPVKGISWIINFIRARDYDPEKVTCPACGFQGDKSTNKKSCRITFVKTSGTEKGAIEHSCFRCWAQYYSKLFLPADKWMAPEASTQVEKVRNAQRKLVL